MNARKRYCTGTSAAAVILLFAVAFGAGAADGDIATIAGTGIAGFSGDGGPAASAQLNTPLGVAKDSAGNTYIADTGNHRIRKIDSAGIITTIAGNGTAGYSGDGGPATSASLNRPYRVAIDSAGNMYIADTRNHSIRKVDTSGVITTVAGNGTLGYSGDGGPATSARLWSPYGLTVDSAGNIYIADTGNMMVRKVDTSGIITPIIASGGYGIPYDVAVDASGNLYVADGWGTNSIYKITASGSMSAVAGNGTAGFSGDGGPATSASLNLPTGFALDSAGNIYIADNGNSRIRKVDTSGVITTVAGNGTAGYSGDGGPATSASLKGPASVAVGSLIVADADNHAVRSVLRSVLSYNLTVTKSGTGGGLVTSSPAGINCGSDCTEAYDQEVSVSLQATADPGSTFTGWSGYCSGIGACSVPMDGGKAVTAIFDTGVPKISVNPNELNFGKVVAETKATPQSVSIWNIGDPGSQLVITGALATTWVSSAGLVGMETVNGAFLVHSNTCTAPLPKGASCAVSVSLLPSSTDVSRNRPLFGTLHIRSNDISASDLEVDLEAVPVSALSSAVPTSVASPNSTISNQTTIDINTIGGLPADFAPDCALSFTATDVNGTADIGITCDALTSSSKAFQRRLDGSLKEIYPTNQCSGIDRVSVADGLMFFRIADNSDCDLNSATGIIDDPIIIGRVASTTTTSTSATTTTTSTTAAASTTTTTTGTTTTTTIAASLGVNVVSGWNLVGNSSSEALDVAAAFGDAAKVTTVWKWAAATAKWAFYAPSLSSQQLGEYAASKGYDVLASIAGGDGFWVNAKTAFSAPAAGGAPVESSAFQIDAVSGQSKLVTGWNLIAIGDNKTPSQFNAAIGATPAAGQIPTNVTTLWAWDANLANWYFYAPGLEAKGGSVLADYIASKNYLDFGANTLGPTTGFWVNKP